MKKILKFIMLIFTAFYPFFMNFFAGAGLIYNKSSYGEDIALIGFFIIFSGLLICSGVIMCLFRKKILNIISLVCTFSGFLICLIMIYLICSHADNAGWSDNYTMNPVSDMYKSRLLPVIFPTILSQITAVVNIKKSFRTLPHASARPPHP
ncbi:MAG: hypothetical protein K2N27_00065 [Ruminococcus sp.]|nr:hypothetical protein [Ruminococcus sp.]